MIVSGGQQRDSAIHIHVSMHAFSVMSYCLQPSRILCPWDSPGKNTGGGYHTFPQGIFPTQELNMSFLCLLNWQVGPLPLASPGKPTRVSVLRQTLLPSRLPRNTEKSSLCWTGGPGWLSVLKTAVWACWSQTPQLSIPFGNQKFIL